MQFDSFRRPAVSINLSALIDVVFILLIFVVLAANFDRLREMNVVLPSAKASQPAQPKALVLTLPVEGPMRLGDEAVTAAELPGRLRALRAQHESLMLVGDGRVPMDQAVRIFDEAAAAGFTSVSIATRKGNP